MTETLDTRITTRVEPSTFEWLTGRAQRMHTGGPQVQARTELGLWRAVLGHELGRLRFTLAEACCLADVLNTSVLDATIVRPGLVWTEAYDAFRLARDETLPGDSSYGAKWGIDEQDLLDRLGRLGPAADHALRDALSRWWEEGCESTVEGFAEVGLTTVGPPSHTATRVGDHA